MRCKADRRLRSTPIHKYLQNHQRYYKSRMRLSRGTCVLLLHSFLVACKTHRIAFVLRRFRDITTVPTIGKWEMVCAFFSSCALTHTLTDLYTLLTFPPPHLLRCRTHTHAHRRAPQTTSSIDCDACVRVCACTKGRSIYETAHRKRQTNSSSVSLVLPRMFTLPAAIGNCCCCG